MSTAGGGSTLVVATPPLWPDPIDPHPHPPYILTYGVAQLATI
ncbi:hypothetical protein [Nostoc sp.]